MRIPSFLLSICLLFASSWSYGSVVVDETVTNPAPIIHEKLIYRDEHVTIKKVTKREELEAFEETRCLDEHLERIHYCLEAPFGVYIAYDNKNMTPVAIQSFCAFTKDSLLMASAMTNVVKAYQGQRFGSVLRTETAKYLDQFLGKRVKMDEEKLSDLPLSCLFSSNEWFFGENYPSLKSALNAGYGISSIAHCGTLDMRCPNDATLWSPRRVDAIVEFSKVMVNPGSASSSAMSNATSCIGYILNDLDFAKVADITTLLSVAERVIRIVKPDLFDGPDYDISPERKGIYQAIYEGPLCKLFKGLDGSNLQLIRDFVEKGSYSPFRNFKGVLQHFVQ